MVTDSIMTPRPGHRVIRVGADGRPWIEAYRCGDCGAVVPDPTLACRRCASRNAPEPFRAARTGRLHTWSVVYRSYPGIEVPFVSAIVDLDDGLALKGTLRDVDIGKLRAGMGVRLEFDDAGGASDREGAPYVGFHFVPEGDSL